MRKLSNFSGLRRSTGVSPVNTAKMAVLRKPPHSRKPRKFRDHRPGKVCASPRLTPRSGRRTIYCMRISARALLVGALAVGAVTLGGLATAPARAQDQAQDRNQDRAHYPDAHSSDPDDHAKPFAPPAASKSVEVADYYFKKKMYTAALSRYQEATKTDSYYAPGYLGLGKTYEKMGLKQKALNAYQKYLDLLPSAKQAEEAKKVHEAMARLEHGLGRSGGHATASGRQAGPAQ